MLSYFTDRGTTKEDFTQFEYHTSMVIVFILSPIFILFKLLK